MDSGTQRQQLPSFLSLQKNMASIASKIHAIIVGMDKYENVNISFERAIKDANAMRNFLIEIGVDEKNIITFEDAKSTTKQEIMKQVASLKEKANRGDPIIFYYSGHEGATNVGERPARMICPYDVASNEGGISDTALVQIFDELAPFCGNNIVSFVILIEAYFTALQSVFLDCSIQEFDFGNPSSCIVMGPDRGAYTDAGGAFTQAMIQVLSDIHEKQQPLDYMTVQSFSAHVQANIQLKYDEICGSFFWNSRIHSIRCAGRNTDRPLFNLMAAEKGHHALVAGQAHIDGRILLNAGAAHGICHNAVYGIYNTNMKSRLQDGSARIGELRVDTINKNDLTVTLQLAVLKKPLPPFFFAVEERDAFEPLRISCNADVEKDLKDYSGWTVSSSDKASAILKKVKDDTISVTWKGLPDGERIRNLERNVADIEEELSGFQPTILRAARFYSQLAEPSPTYLTPTKLLVRLQKVELGQESHGWADAEETNPKNLLDDEEFKPRHVFLSNPWKPEDNPASYTLTITNKHTYNVWLYVYLFDVEGFAIGAFSALDNRADDAITSLRALLWSIVRNIT